MWQVQQLADQLEAAEKERLRCYLDYQRTNSDEARKAFEKQDALLRLYQRRISLFLEGMSFDEVKAIIQQEFPCFEQNGLSLFIQKSP